MIFLRLFYEFFKTGSFAVGGGLATLPFLRDIANKTGWFSEDLLADMLAVSESTPGPIGVNMATYAGYQTAGIPGAIIATLGLITPAIIVMLIVSGLLDHFKGNLYVEATFYGLRPAVAGLIAVAGISVAKSSLVNLPFNGDVLSFINLPSVFIFVASFILLKLTKKHPIIYLAGSALMGIVLGMF